MVSGNVQRMRQRMNEGDFHDGGCQSPIAMDGYWEQYIALIAAAIAGLS
jgi:hypothetical protein